jgi:hypothetical protein
MADLQQAAAVHAEALRQAAWRWMTPAEKRLAGKRQSPSGAYRAAVRGYHRCEKRLALGTGQPLSPEVLADYPELTTQQPRRASRTRRR